MTFTIFHNPAATRSVPDAGFRPESRVPGETHASMPGYAPTPLHDCAGLARRLGVATVLVKDESERLGLPSFKILGASWATLTTILREWTDGQVTTPTVKDVATRLGAARGRGLVAATDGNHGRGVARMAALLDLDAHILVPAGTAQARIDAIAGEGARVDVVDGTYDDAIAVSASLADEDHLVISDTSWAGYEDAPRAVVEGYSTMFFEIDDAIAARNLDRPSLVALQAGVGSFAAAGLRHYRGPRDAHADQLGHRPTTVIIEPSSANCLMASAEAGALTEVPGPHRSSMAGLNCGLPSELVWPILHAGSDAFIAIDDEHAAAAMSALADEGIVAGESGAASLGGLLALADYGTEHDRARLGLRTDACVLIVNTEGATDPVNYRTAVGRMPHEVAARDGAAETGVPA